MIPFLSVFRSLKRKTPPCFSGAHGVLRVSGSPAHAPSLNHKYKPQHVRVSFISGEDTSSPPTGVNAILCRKCHRRPNWGNFLSGYGLLAVACEKTAAAHDPRGRIIEHRRFIKKNNAAGLFPVGAEEHAAH